jgi:hypothetical protein
MAHDAGGEVTFAPGNSRGGRCELDADQAQHEACGEVGHCHMPFSYSHAHDGHVQAAHTTLITGTCPCAAHTPIACCTSNHVAQCLNQHHERLKPTRLPCSRVAGVEEAGMLFCSARPSGAGCGDDSGCGCGGSKRHAQRRALCARTFTMQPVSRPLLVSWLLAIFVASAPTTIWGATFAGIGKVVGGDDGTHRLTLTTDEDGAELLRVLKDVTASDEATRGRDPSIGVASWNSVEKFYYYAAAEDGFASAYLTPYSYVTNQSISQRVLRGRTDTSFTLTSIQYNRIDAKIYGIITYSSGEHFMVRVMADTRVGQIKVELIFEALLQLDYTHIAPGLSAMDTNRDDGARYYACGLKTLNVNGKRVQQGYLFALTTGVAPTGTPKPSAHLWSRELPGVLTSLQADPSTGNLYGMLHNVSGHFLLHFDPTDEGKFGDTYVYQTRTADTYRKADPAKTFNMTADTEVIFGLASFSPPANVAGRAAEADYFSVVYNRIVDENGTQYDRYNILAQNLGNLLDQRVNPNITSEEFTITNQAGYTMTSMQVMYTTIPTISKLEPSVAHIVGGMLVTVVGQPFVDTGPGMIRCRWKLYDKADRLSGVTLYSTSASFVNTSVCVCITPKTGTRVKGIMDLTLTNGAIWTSNYKKFVFFETTLRTPLMGSSKGRAFVQIRGLYLRDLPVLDMDFVDSRGIPGVVRDGVNEAQCEFGKAPAGYAFDSKAVTTGDPMFQVQGNPPDGPVMRKSQCMNITVGLDVEEVCILSCFSPPAPADKCIQGSTRACSLFYRKCPVEWEPSVTPCRMMIPPYAQIPFSFTIYGQRVPMGTWAFDGDKSPIMVGAKFMDDGSCIVIQTDLDTNKGRSIGGAVSASSAFLYSDLLFGENAQLTYPLRNRLMVCMGYEATCTTSSFYYFRPAALGSRFNWFFFLKGTFVLDETPNDRKPRPGAHIIAPGTSAMCTRIRVNGGGSYYSGGRALDYRWGMRASKCIDVNCLNSVIMNEQEHLWPLPAQRSLYYTKSAEFDAELALTGKSNTLDLASVNRLTWLLQTTNFFYSDYIEDTQKLIDGDALNFAYVPRCQCLLPCLRTASGSATLERFDGCVLQGLKKKKKKKKIHGSLASPWPESARCKSLQILNPNCLFCFVDNSVLLFFPERLCLVLA